MRGWVKAAAVVALALATGAAARVPPPKPADPVIALHTGLVRIFAAPNGPSETQIAALTRMTFDMPAVTLAVLGDAGKAATPSERARLQRVLVQRLARLIALGGRQDAGDGFTVTTTRAVGGADWLVSTRERRPASGGGAPQAVVLDWRVRREGARFRIVDNLRDGLSTVGVQQDDFAAQAKGRDLNAVIAQMERRAAAARPGG